MGKSIQDFFKKMIFPLHLQHH